MKKQNFLGIRTKTILCRTKGIVGDRFTVMRAITEKQEKELDTREQTTLDNGATVSRKSIYIYGEVDLTSEEDIEKVIANAIDKLPERCREIFLKSRIEGMKYREIADE